jgi:hypothetical protein
MPYLASRWLRSSAISRVIAAAVLAALVAAALAKLPDHLPHVERRSMWPTVALWDLAAVSVEEHRILIPPSLLMPGLTLQEIESDFVPFTNTSTFQTDKILLSLRTPYTAKQDRDLLRAWLTLPFQHPAAYWRHRWRLTRFLFGSGGQGRPYYLVLQPEVQQLAGNPPMAINRSALNRWAITKLLRLTGTPLFGGWPYLALAVLVLATSLRRSERAHHALAATIAASGLCYALPLCVLSGAADFRYLSWLMGASLIAGVKRIVARRLLITSPASPPRTSPSPSASSRAPSARGTPCAPTSSARR